MTDAPDALYHRPLFRAAAGSVLRPGGLELTAHALKLCGFAPDHPGPSGVRALDVGCGTGATLALLRARGFIATGVDPDAAMLAEARSAAGDDEGRGRLLQGRAEDLPVPDASQEVALCECVLSLCAEPERAVAELFRVLVPGGYLILADVIQHVGQYVGQHDGQYEGRYDRRHDGRMPGAPGASCLAGALPLPRLRELLRHGGFRLEHEELHDRKLAELGARLIFGGESLSGLGRWLGAGCGTGSLPRDLLRALGYVLLTARKEDI